MDLITLHYAGQGMVAIHFDDIAYIDETSEKTIIYFRENRGLSIEWIKVKETIEEIKGKYNAERGYSDLLFNTTQETQHS